MPASTFSSRVPTWIQAKLENMIDKSRNGELSRFNYEPKTLMLTGVTVALQLAETYTVQTVDNESSSHFQSIEVGLSTPRRTEIIKIETERNQISKFLRRIEENSFIGREGKIRIFVQAKAN